MGEEKKKGVGVRGAGNKQSETGSPGHVNEMEKPQVAEIKCGESWRSER